MANFGFSVHTLVGAMVWPIYLAVLVPDFRSVGAITTAAALIAVVVLLVVGRLNDQGKCGVVLISGTVGVSVLHASRLLASSHPIALTSVATLYDILLGGQQNSWSNLYHTHTRRGGINYMMSMEIMGDIASLVIFSTLGIVAYLAGGGVFFVVAFSAAAFLAWLCLFIRREVPAARAV